jgi:IMP dehydrogenase
LMWPMAPIKLAKDLKKHYPDQEIILGNIATHEAVESCGMHGFIPEVFKVGIGPGATCSTRIIAGAGVPQVSAILDCARASEKSKIAIIADGGIRYPRDVTISIGCGAKAVMIGTLFAGTDESPGEIIHENGHLFKIVRGMSSLDVNLGIKGDEFLTNGIKESISPEGVVKRVPYAGSLARVLVALVSGLRSGMTYVGANTIAELRRPFDGKFTRMSRASWEESKQHDVGMF